MSKKRKDSICIIYEGYREGYFLEHLKKYSEVHLNPQPCNGGSADQIVINGIKYSANGINVYVLFDEDFESKPNHKISDDILESIAREWKLTKNALIGCPYRQLQSKNVQMKNPFLIVSYPQSIEGFLLRLLDIPEKEKLEGKTTKQLKNMIEGMLGNVQLQKEDNEQIRIYEKKIIQYKEEINKLKQSEPNNKKHCHYFEGKIENLVHKKNKVTFIRFLSDNLPLPIINAKRNEIPEIDILLKAFGL